MFSILYEVRITEKDKNREKENLFGLKEELLIKQAEMAMQKAESEFERELTIKKVEIDLKQQKLDIKKELYHLEVLKNRHRRSTLILKKTCSYCVKKIDLEAHICPFCGMEDKIYAERWNSKKKPKIEKMTLIQIEISSEPNKNSPFIKGINTIVIPSSVFFTSKLISRSHIIDDKNSLKGKEITMRIILEKGFTELKLIEQPKNPPSKNDGIEFLITKKNCSPKIAEEMLNLILTGLLNETMGKEVLI